VSPQAPRADTKERINIETIMRRTMLAPFSLCGSRCAEECAEEGMQLPLLAAMMRR
jgi:hypothetical protein